MFDYFDGTLEHSCTISGRAFEAFSCLRTQSWDGLEGCFVKYTVLELR